MRENASLKDSDSKLGFETTADKMLIYFTLPHPDHRGYTV